MALRFTEIIVSCGSMYLDTKYLCGMPGHILPYVACMGIITSKQTK